MFLLLEINMWDECTYGSKVIMCYLVLSVKILLFNNQYKATFRLSLINSFRQGKKKSPS